MKGWAFPKIFEGNSVKLVEGVEAVIQDLKLLFEVEPMEFGGDPGFGSNMKLLKFRPKNQLTLDLMVDAICQSQLFIPNVVFSRDSVKIAYKKGGEVDITIRAVIDKNNYIQEIHLVQEDQANG